MQIKFTLPNPMNILMDIGRRLDIWHLFFLNLALRLFVVSFPSDGGMIFDEVHYIKAVRAMMEGIAANGEHPPLTKIIGLVSIRIFGDFWVAWRLPMILFSIWIPVLVYKISYHFTKSKGKSLFAAMFSMFDMVLFIHGNIFMLEIPALVFTLLFVLLYLEKRYVFASLAISLGFLCNEKALYGLLGVAIYHVVTNWNPSQFKINIKPVGIFLTLCVLFGGGGLFLSDLVWKPSRSTTSSVVVNAVVYQNATDPYTTSYTTITNMNYDYITDPFSHVWFMFTYFNNIAGGIPMDPATWRPPWSWIGPFGPNWNNPPTYFSTVASMGEKQNRVIDYRPVSNYPIWWMTIPLFILGFIYRKEKQALFGIAWICGTYLTWVIWELPKMYIPFNHYMMFAIPGLCIGTPWFWGKISPKYQYYAMILQLFVSIVIFAVYFPVGLFRIF